jgi:hypothetical protein
MLPGLRAQLDGLRLEQHLAAQHAEQLPVVIATG